jgi:hypothetical protein
VWSVWVDQAWFARHVHPRLSNQKQKWAMLFQAMLGSALVVLIPAATLGGILTATGVLVNWNGLARHMALALGAAFFAASCMTRNPAMAMASHGVVLGVVASVTFGLVPMAVLVSNEYIASCILSRVVSVSVVGLVGGIGMGVFRGIILGDRSSIASAITVAGGVAVIWSVMGITIEGKTVNFSVIGSIVESITGAMAIGLGLYLGGHWATRQTLGREVNSN